MPQPSSEWPADAGAIITEMKRRAAVRTDHELARFMAAAQSTVSNWRKRGTVPESAIRQFELALEGPQHEKTERTFAARAIAMRLPELWFQQMRSGGASAGRYIPYNSVAIVLNAIIAEIERQMIQIEDQTGLATRELCSRLLDDEHFLHGIIKWLKETAASEMLMREVRASRRPKVDE